MEAAVPKPRECPVGLADEAPRAALKFHVYLEELCALSARIKKLLMLLKQKTI